MWFFALSLQLFNKYVNFATVVTLHAHTAYMWDVESRRSQVKIYSNKTTKACGLFFSRKNIWLPPFKAYSFSSFTKNNKCTDTTIKGSYESHTKLFFFYAIGVTVVSQQSFWGVDRYWEAVSQSLVYSEDVYQVREILCGTPGHDQRKGGSKKAWKKLHV